MTDVQAFAAVGIAGTGFALGLFVILRSLPFWRVMVRDTELMSVITQAINEEYDDNGDPHA